MARSLFKRRQILPPQHDASPSLVPKRHAVLGTPLEPPFPSDIETASHPAYRATTTGSAGA